MTNGGSPASRMCLICNCERTMELDGARIGQATGQDGLTVHSHLCRSGIGAFEQALGDRDLLVACTQEAPLFAEVAEDGSHTGALDFINIRETGGWTTDGDANPKIAALLAAASAPVTPTGIRALRSDGMCLVYGSGTQAMDAAKRLADRLSVTLVLVDPEDMSPPDVADVAIAKGRIASATGHLGAFEVTVDGYAPLAPSSRGSPEFLMPRDGAKSSCDLILDLSGGAPLFVGHERRSGYFRADPARPSAIAEKLFDIVDWVGEFEKPIYVQYDEAICAHERNGKAGCNKCLDACPAGAILPAGDGVAYDTAVCGGCGSCAAVCPSGAVDYRYPGAGDMVARLQALTAAFDAAGGNAPTILFHDEDHGQPILSAIARHGRGLPVDVLPLAVHAVTAIGHETILSAFASGACRVVILASPERRFELDPLEAEVTLGRAILEGFDLGVERLDLLVEADPDAVEAALYQRRDLTTLPVHTFDAIGTKRERARTAILKLHETAGADPGVISLPDGAPYGAVHVDAEGCTLCLACVSACPADALRENPDRPEVRFIEAACLQCGICKVTCPENVITLEPRLDLSTEAMQPRTLHFEEPFHCVECGKPFGTRATVEKIVEKLAGKHAMFEKPDAVRVIEMCDDCRIIWQANQADNPFAMGARPKSRTTADYVAARDENLSIDDFLKED